MKKVFKSAKEAHEDATREADEWIARMEFDDQLTQEDYNNILIREEQKKDATS